MSKASPKSQLAIVGLGRLGSCMAQGLRRNPSFVIQASVRESKKAKKLSAQFRFPILTENKKIVRGADLIVLAVKPKQAEGVLRELRSTFKKNQILISVCASVTLSQLKKWAGPKPSLIRAMPNLPCLIGEGVSVLTPQARISPPQLRLVRELFEALGDVLFLDESSLDAVTALSACGPAFIFTIIEALIDAGVKVGLRRDDAKVLVLRTLIGSGAMLERTGLHPAELKDQVTTPAGCTIDGLQALEEGRLRATLLKAIVASTRRASRLRVKSS